MKKNRSKKGQIFSIDLVVAVIVFIFILIASFWAWHITENRINYIRTIRDMTIIAQNSVNTIVSTHGHPTDWFSLPDDELINIQSFGIIYNKKGVASTDKIARLQYLSALDYNKTKEKLGIIGPGMEFYLMAGDYNIGSPMENARDVVIVNRAMALENGTFIPIKMRVWRK